MPTDILWGPGADGIYDPSRQATLLIFRPSSATTTSDFLPPTQHKQTTPCPLSMYGSSFSFESASSVAKLPTCCSPENQEIEPYASNFREIQAGMPSQAQIDVNTQSLTAHRPPLSFLAGTSSLHPLFAASRRSSLSRVWSSQRICWTAPSSTF
jgi:hypothetical protein